MRSYNCWRSLAYFVTRALLTLVLCLMLTSCWSSHNIEDQSYLTAIGIDYKDGEYIVYGQEMNFKEIDNPTVREDNESKGIIVGKGTGKTMYEAAYNLAKSAQGRVEWGHFQTIVISEEAMQHDNINSIRKLNRFPDTRINCWLFITKDPIETIFSTSNLYDDASLRIILYNPTLNYQQNSLIKPVIAFEIVADYLEPDRTVILPVVSINDENWEANHKPLNVLEIKGAYIASLYGKHLMLDEDEAKLLRSTFIPSRFAVTIEKDEESMATVSLEHTKKNIHAQIVGTEINFTLDLSYKGSIFEYLEDMPYEEMVQHVKQNIEDEIREVYLLGLEEEVDVLNLMPSLRHKNPKAWRELTDSGKRFILTEDSLADIKIKVTIPFNGKYKRVPDKTN